MSKKRRAKIPPFRVLNSENIFQKFVSKIMRSCDKNFAQLQQRIRRNKTELLDEYIGEYAYNKYLKNNINEKQDVKRYLLYALVLSRIYGTQRVYKTILQFFKKINEED